MAKIVVINVIEDGRFGGPQKRILNIAKTINHKIETVVVCGSNNSNYFQSQLKLNGIQVHCVDLALSSRGLFNNLKFLFFFIFDVVKLYLIFKKHNHDLIHISGGALSFRSFIAAKFCRSKVVWHLNDTKQPKIVLWVFSLLSRFSDAYIFASDASKKFYSAFINEQKPSFILYSPVSFVMDKRIQANNNNFSVGSVVNINPNKVDHLLDLAVASHDMGFPLHFYIAGPVYATQRNYFNQVQKRIKASGLSNITFLGPIKDIKAFHKSLNIYLCMSKYEASPTALWEAMASGLLVVSTPVGDAKKFIVPNSGFIFSFNEIPIIPKFLYNACLDIDQFLDVRNNALITAKNNFSLEHIAEKYIKAYTTLSVGKHAYI
ncbi:glycosyltransferase [Alphaproteobacteria bacterium]|nr:glycosyltransferase [Alphaproteobacteria bacterium]